LFLDMVFTYDDAQRPNSHKEKLFSLLVFFLANYKVSVTVVLLIAGHRAVELCVDVIHCADSFICRISKPPRAGGCCRNFLLLGFY
jgi:hypothetical protein